MTRLYVYIGIIILAVLMGLGAFWQHNRYVALSDRFEAIQEANKGLAEASKKAEAVSTVKTDASKDVTQLVIESNKKTQQQIKELAEAVEKGSADEKALMSSPLPVDVVRMLDNAYQSGDKGGDAP